MALFYQKIEEIAHTAYEFYQIKKAKMAIFLCFRDPSHILQLIAFASEHSGRTEEDIHFFALRSSLRRSRPAFLSKLSFPVRPE